MLSSVSSPFPLPKSLSQSRHVCMYCQLALVPRKKVLIFSRQLLFRPLCLFLGTDTSAGAGTRQAVYLENPGPGSRRLVLCLCLCLSQMYQYVSGQVGTSRASASVALQLETVCTDQIRMQIMFYLGMSCALLVLLGLRWCFMCDLRGWGCFSLGNAMPVSRLDLGTTQVPSRYPQMSRNLWSVPSTTQVGSNTGGIYPHLKLGLILPVGRRLTHSDLGSHCVILLLAPRSSH